MYNYDTEFKIIPVREHYEVYRNGKFFCSADTITEAAREIEKEKEVYFATI